MSQDLTYRRVDRAALTDPQVERMFDLMRTSYDLVSAASFEKDLSWKDEVLVLFDRADTIQGFSTLAFNPAGSGTADYDVLYSGDTIIDPAHWGSQELVRGFCQTAGRIFAERKKPLYWYLLSKGYRTYLYLPLFTHDYFPMAGTSADPARLGSIADRCSRLLFGDAWNPQTGVLQFAQSLGQLKPELADDTQQRARNRHVAFFLERNPGFAKGDELVCVAELSPENTRRIAARFFLEGMDMADAPAAEAAARL